MQRKWLTRATGLLLLLAGTAGLAGDPQVIASRVANFREIGTANKAITDELKLKQPDINRIRDAARLIKGHGDQMLTWFPPGSEPAEVPEQGWLDTILGWFGGGSGGDSLALPDEAETKAKIEVWKKPAEFKEAHRVFQIEANKLWQVAQKGEMASIAPRFQALGKTCEACHQKFRVEED